MSNKFPNVLLTWSPILFDFSSYDSASPTGTYDQYFRAFAVRETVGGFDFTKTPNYQAESRNDYPALGAYQFDKNSLIAVGYYRNDGDLNGSHWQDTFFTGKDGISSKQAFLDNPTVQDNAARAWTLDVGWKSTTDLGLQKYIGQTIGGIHITAAALLGGASLLGPDAVKQFIESNGQSTSTDSYGTPISEYMSNFSGFQTPFDPAPTLDNAPGTATSPAIFPSTEQITPSTTSKTARINLSLSEDPWQGDAQFSVAIDGNTIGNPQTVTALHSNGASQDFSFDQALAAGTHDVAVSFLNGAYGNTPSNDGSLHVNSISVDGTSADGAAATLYSTATQHFLISIPVHL